MAKGRSGRRGEAKPPAPPLIDALFGPDQLVEHAGTYRSPSPAGVEPPDKKVLDYKASLASVADRYLATKSSRPQTQPAPDPPESDLQTPDKSSEAPLPSPSPKPQAGRVRRLAPGQWVTK